MKTILHLACSPRGANAYSRMLSDELVAGLLARNPGARATLRDLSATPPPMVDAAFSAAILGAPDFAAPALVESEALIAELEAADAVVLATPMHNFGVPAVLKAWVDQIVRIHRTFASTPQGKIGKLADKPVYVVVSSGGWFTGPTPAGAPAQPDFLTPYLRTVFETIGIRSVSLVTIEGAARGAEIAERAFAAARARIGELLG